MQLLFQSEKRLSANIARDGAQTCSGLRANEEQTICDVTTYRRTPAQSEVQETSHRHARLLFEVEKVACSRSEKEQIAVCDHMYI